MIPDGHVDPFANEIHDLFHAAGEDAFVQDACRLVGTPSRVDIRAAIQEIVRDLVVPVLHRPGQSPIDDLLNAGQW